MVTTRTLTALWLAGLLGGCASEAESHRLGSETGSGGRARGEPNEATSGGTVSGSTAAGCGQGCNHAGGASSSTAGQMTTGRGGDAGKQGVAEAETAGASQGKAYPGHGFVVHEWGTDTVVVGSDGSQQRGLHHEEEDLPAFVYDRRFVLGSGGTTGAQSVEGKMETPVTYFYSDVARSVSATVTFPKGILTQWYPGVQSFAPPLALPPGTTEPADPVLDPAFPFVKELCRDRYSAVANGRLSWGPISILARDANATVAAAEAPLDRFSWSYARNVAANQLQVTSGESERFLFYRGLGNFEVPLAVSARPGGRLALANRLGEALGTIFVIHTDHERGAFTTHQAGLAPRAELATEVPTLEGAEFVEPYAEHLGQAVTDALDGTGLYRDEAVAMVSTWKRQWFRTPGTRLLYVVPQSWTEASIPLSIEPRPDSTVRVMLIRVELITPEEEQSDVQAVLKLADNPDLARSHFTALGRFAEPRLRRALALSPSALGNAYLAEIQGANSSSTCGE